MIKSTNLRSTESIIERNAELENDELIANYLVSIDSNVFKQEKGFENKIKKIKSEFFAICKLLDSLDGEIGNESQLYNYEGFYLGYIIPRISKEMDILRFSEEYILNIEIKREITTKEKMSKQLIRNKYYLNFLNENTKHFVYFRLSN